MDIIFIRAYIMGFGRNGEPVCVQGALDVASGTLVVADTVAYKTGYDPENLPKNIAIITNDAKIPRRDVLFTEADLALSVQAYMEMSQRLLKIEAKAMRFHPRQVLEARGMDERGQKYDFNPESVDNGHIAILALCMYAVRQRAVGNMLSFSTPDKGDDEGVADMFSI